MATLKRNKHHNKTSTMEPTYESHVLLLPYPSQGHINPMLQFAKRLSSHNIKTTMAITRFICRLTRPEPGPVSVESISDGFDENGVTSAQSVEHYLTRFESVGSETLSDLVESLRSRNKPVRVLIYDAFLPWAADVANRFGLRTASFFTQACAVDAILWQAWLGRVKYPVTEPVRFELPGLPVFEPRDLPSFLSDPDPGPYPAYLELVLNQYRNLEKADVVLINSVYELEPEEFNWMKSSNYRVKSIGPTIPSTYLDGRIPSDSSYTFNLHAPDSRPYLPFLSSKPDSSVLYVSFGSMASLPPTQTLELASTLSRSAHNFLWVVRSSETSKLPPGFAQRTEGRGLVVTWCNQLEVLAHAAVGCFLTHCGWNSVSEGIALGVPMVGMPQWTDQTTNAKYVEDVWRVGVRVRAGEDGVVRREELERGIGEVMGEGGRGEEIRRNAGRWKELVKGAMREGGSSDRNIVGFVDEYCRSSK